MSFAPEDFAADLSDESIAASKQESFEQSSLKLVMAQLGASKTYIKKLIREEPVDFGWFNQKGWIEADLLSQRFFKYNLLSDFQTPGKSPVVEQFIEYKKQQASSGWPLILLFKCHQIGRMVATDIVMRDRTHLHLVYRNYKVNITPMSGFFSETFGNILGDS